MNTNRSAEFEHLCWQINDALGVYREKGLPVAEAIPEITKFVSALGLKANGPAVTIEGLRDLADQLEHLWMEHVNAGHD